jgi:nitrous oxidase accessory protein
VKVMFIGDCLRKLTSTALVITLLLVSTGIASAGVIYVDPGASIQAAVNNSTTGDFIIVKSGDYEENVVVNVSGVTITSEPEKPDNVLIRARDDNLSVFQVKADNVTISGFNITGSGEIFNAFEAASSRNYIISRGQSKSNVTDNPEAVKAYGLESGEISVSGSNGFDCPQSGICLNQVENCTIERNRIFENQHGIYLQGSMNNTLSDNTCFRNGIWIDEECSKNKVMNNSIEKGNIIIGAHCWDNKIIQNRLSNGGGIGIACCGGGNLVSKNDIVNCSTGIDIYDTQARTVLSDNLIKDCDYGIYLIFVFDSRVYNNTISNSTRGIFLRENSQSNELFNNIITFSNESGIYLLDHNDNNRIYNNYFNNTVNVKTENSEGNIWNTTKTFGPNIMKGPYLGGNFWADLNGTGFSQTAEDSDSDGISDVPYNVNGSDFDYLPLTEPPFLSGVDLKFIIEESKITRYPMFPANLTKTTLVPNLAFRAGEQYIDL